MTNRAKHLIKTAALIAAALAAVPTHSAQVTEELAAAGIRTDFGDVLIENLGIGRTYNLRDLAGMPLKVTNTGKDTIDLRIDSEIPRKDSLPQGRLEKGYEPVPSVEWVSLGQNQFVLPPGESAFTDVIIKIPDDPSLFGRKFQASIFSRSVDRRFLNLGVWSHILINIVASPEMQKKIEENRKRGVVDNMDYALIPDKVVFVNAPLGRSVDILKELKKTIRMANSGDKPIDLRLKVIPVGSSPLTLQQGYEEPADLKWLTMKSDVFTVEPSSFEDPGLVLKLPNDPKLHKKKLMFVIKVDPADPNIVGVTYFGKLYVEVE